MSQFLRHLARDTAGNALMMFAGALLPILLMIGSGLDASITYMARNKMQNACDAGALAGRLAMIGTDWTTDAETEANKFFDFNFPVGTNGVENVQFNIEPDASNASQLLGTATGTVPTTIMFLVGYDSIDISVECDATRDMGHNDVMLVLDMTSSMLNEPSWGGGTPKVELLRNGTMGLYSALDDDGGGSGSITRYGFMPFSQTVNVARQLQNNDIVRRQQFVDGSGSQSAGTFVFSGLKEVAPNEMYWNNGQNGNGNNANAIIQGFRTSGEGCIEERPAYGNDYNNGEFVIGTTVTLNDINEAPANGSDEDTQWGRYEPSAQEGYVWDACVSEAKQFAEYASETDFETAVSEVSAITYGGTVSDIGMLWGVRFASQDGLFASNNPKTVDDWPVNVHIIFFTDGHTYNTGTHYTAYGVERYTHRIAGDGVAQDQAITSTDLIAKHNERLSNICTLAKSMGMTIWVVVLDSPTYETYQNCATSSAHYHESDGSDLEEVFTTIGQGIGNLRLTK